MRVCSVVNWRSNTISSLVQKCCCPLCYRFVNVINCQNFSIAFPYPFWKVELFSWKGSISEIFERFQILNSTFVVVDQLQECDGILYSWGQLKVHHRQKLNHLRIRRLDRNILQNTVWGRSVTRSATGYDDVLLAYKKDKELVLSWRRRSRYYERSRRGGCSCGDAKDNKLCGESWRRRFWKFSLFLQVGLVMGTRYHSDIIFTIKYRHNA